VFRADGFAAGSLADLVGFAGEQMDELGAAGK
jgi:hypothetical protein